MVDVVERIAMAVRSHSSSADRPDSDEFLAGVLPLRGPDSTGAGISPACPVGGWGMFRTGTAYPGLPWEPEAAFHTLAKYGRSRTRTSSPDYLIAAEDTP
ncbi:hypothetical protein ACFQ6Q_25555 [Streptomyces sp. NPDC056437]|uniref:hypothetical protein n=1 Tax=Streptomyces sp. NPDC056437 TaxID=3345816 RepID=UPI0036A55A97